jgi:hypothetical protein
MSVSSKGYISISSSNRTNFPLIGTPGANNSTYQNINLDVVGLNGFGVSEVFFDDGNTNITKLNNRIYWEDNSQSFEAEVPPGQYDFVSFATVLQSVMVAQQAGITVTTTPEGIFTINFPNQTTFIKPITPDGVLYYTGKLIQDMLNIDSRIQNINSHVSVSPAKLFYSCYVDFVSNRMSYGCKLRDTDSNKKISDIICRIYFDNPSVTRKTIKEFKNIKWISSDLTNNQDFDIKLFDEFGNPYDEVNIMYSLLILTT